MKGKKLNKEEVNEKLNARGRGIELIGEYVTNKTNSLFRCSNNHIWEAAPNNIINGGGCPICGKINKTFTKEIINERIKDSGIELIGKYINVETKALFRCPNGHIREAFPNNILRNTGCGRCSSNFPLTKEDVNERIKDKGIELIGKYTTTKTKTLFRCFKNHIWEATPSNILYGRGCPTCASSGFKTNIPAHGYLLDFGHFIKFGISNTLEVRLKSHTTYNGKFTVIKTKLFDNGQDALDWENDIKKKYGGSYVSKDILPHGFTETLPMCFKETLITMLDN